ncbi:hypothetical protein Sked_03610 [Sanguibacter keddieii DSM 10542]|uniref:DUF4194 domain-containing protein n=1 Tax=Sanguibacter keddieii (strain ATCC 51767 / DSM 10542 / NCFB 3025 / ST-74) TaxID=446469 RepID=D1BJS2_SANKS|nr:DUF4194 domain-containing protein [Sanguibacter keddieii]ACZ20328.1 hypothetical protein Sked_03610 [Sanguibacter keddieii DSM 10542]
MSQPTARADSELSHVVTALMKGVVYRDTHAQTFADLITLQPQVRDYVAVIGLSVVVDDTEGYAYLRSMDDDTEREGTLRLVARRSLPFEVSLLLALLRKRLALFDSEGGQTRLILGRDEIVEMVRVFLPTSSNEVRLVTRVEGMVHRAVELGFLRGLGEGQYEVRRVLKAFVDAQWLADLDARLAEYSGYAAQGHASQAAQDVQTDGTVE